MRHTRFAADLKMAAGLYGRSILAGAAGFFVFMCIELLFTGLFTHRIGYRVYQPDDAGTPQLIGEFYYDNLDAVYEQLGITPGETAASDTADGTTTTTIRLTTEEIRSTLSPALTLCSRLLSQVCMFLLYASMLYSPMWTQGDKDRNLMQFEHIPADPWRGLREGALAAIPSAIAFLALVGSKLGFWWPTMVQSYRFAHFAFFPLYLWLVPNDIRLTADLPWPNLLGLLLFVLTLPAIAAVAYHLGCKQFSLGERLVYARTRKKK